MKRILSLLIMIFIITSIVFLGISCKKEVSSESSAETTAAETTAAAETTTAAETTAELTKFASEEEWLASLKGKYAGKEFDLVTTAFCSAPDIDASFLELTGAKVNLLTSAWDDFVQKSRTLLSTKASEGMDAYLIDASFLGEYGNNGWYTPVQDMIFESDKNEIVQSFLDMYTYSNGDLIGVPFNASSFLLFYNPEMLAKGGYDSPPKTLDELRSMSMDLIKKGICKYGTSMELTAGDEAVDNWTEILVSMGGKLWNKDFTAPAFNEGGYGLKALNYIVDGMYTDKWINPSSVNWTRDDANQPFLKGEEPFKIQWQFQWSLVKDPKGSKVSNIAKFATVPMNEGAVTNSFIAGGAFGVNPNSKNIELAKDYCRYFAAKVNMISSFEKRGTLPMWKSLYSDPKAVAIEPSMPIILEGLRLSSMYIAVAPWKTAANEIIYGELASAFNKQISPEEALKNIETKINQRFQENWE